MLSTSKIAKAILYAKAQSRAYKDEVVSTKATRFVMDESRLAIVLNKHRRSLVGAAIPQACRVMDIPPQWVTTKYKLEDGTHLADSFDRHKKMLGEKSLWCRSQKRDCFAIFNEGTKNIDILPMLRLINEHVLPECSWYKIWISDRVMKFFGIIKSANPRVAGGIYVTTSDDGSFGIKVSGGYGARDQFSILPAHQFSFKRMEGEEGALKNRVIKTLQKLIRDQKEIRISSRKHLTILTECKIGDNLVSIIEQGRKLLGYPKSVDGIVLGMWPKESKGLEGYWRALMATAAERTLGGDFLTAHNLHLAAGKLLTLTNPVRFSWGMS